MHSPYDDYVRSLREARKARRRGDIGAADHWTRIAERHLRMATRLAELKSPFLMLKPYWTPLATLEDEKARVLAGLNTVLAEMANQPPTNWDSQDPPDTSMR